MGNPVIVDAVRTPFGKRNGALSGMHPAHLLGRTLTEICDRSGIASGDVEQAIGGCVDQVGEQSSNVTRNAWLTAGLDTATACSTVHTQCGSAQQAVHLVAGLIAADAMDVGIACGVEVMSRVPLHSSIKAGPGHPRPESWPVDLPTQFVGADRIARDFGLSRRDLDAWGLLSQRRAADAWREERFVSEVFSVEVPELDEEGRPTGNTRVVSRDQGLRDTSSEALAALRPIEEDGLHTAGTTSQLSDGATAVLLMSESAAARHALPARARIRAQAVIGDDPYYHLNGPIAATARVLDRAGMTLDDIDVIEVNEAFAAVVLNWVRHYEADPARVNVNGGAIALGHPVGASGGRLVGTAVHQLERTGGTTALVVMCAGGAQATATIIERL
ncbi:steroid 3-ketoacyl-CoA thiolase [Streptomyces flaveolus]|uniref:steroid 3-ketoacyl-CoA thiolase n=1 Tax=Streptomyces flaveolus TaxID=67297 RepID=UPI00069D8464|nr:steroid 3-ketoacyl-CoA thiolase [Streptomyces antibioticus]KOG61371.1 acetyl-CoA acetyltransferase [Streptomyces antibioticus]